jgi:lipopolysaccharide export system permease protein
LAYKAGPNQIFVGAPAIAEGARQKGSMDRLDRYIFRTSFHGFVVVLVSLTAVIWVTQILRQIDLITSQGQTVLAFFSITSLIIPSLMLVLAPIAMLIAVLYTLVRLNNDSELVVMSAAGLSPSRLFRPFLALAAVVALLVLFIGAYLSPQLQRELLQQISKVRADMVINIVRPGAFTTIEKGLTVHVREKRGDAQFGGIMIDDARADNERTTVIAEEGHIVQNDRPGQSTRSTFLVMNDGWVQRRRAADRDPTFVQFESYAFDLSPYTVAWRVSYGLREKYLWELLNPDPEDRLLKTAPAQFRVELHDRLLAPIYPFAFVVIACALMCVPRTTRQGGFLSMLAVGIAALGLRLFGFACMAIGRGTPSVVFLVYPAVVVVIAFGGYAIYRGVGIDVERRIDLTALRDRLLGMVARIARLAPR